MTQIKIRIDQKGEVEIKVEGQVGPGCKDLTKGLEKAFGTKIKDVETGEYYEQEESQTNQINQY